MPIKTCGVQVPLSPRHSELLKDRRNLYTVRHAVESVEQKFRGKVGWQQVTVDRACVACCDLEIRMHAVSTRQGKVVHA